jgi:hypothetical protein
MVPDTLNYMIAGYIVVGLMVLGYIFSLALRWRKTKMEYLSLKKNQD